ncbi:MAG: ABC transporter substrate-binding protein [Lachnospiraceae bacterium]|nr:ABC transporter substrate-binding protein [Lachnospiraceae bacterium]
MAKRISRRDFLRGSAAGAALVAMTGLTGAVASAESEGTKDLVVSLSSSPSKLDPIHYTGTYEGQIIGEVCDRLIEYNDSLDEYVPSLAASWEVSEDGLTYVFQIRDDVYFQTGTYQDGRQMTVDDIVYSLNRSAEYSDNNRLSMLDYAEATGDWEVTCHLTAANSAFMTALTDAGNSIVPEEEVEGWGDDFGFHLIGTGPFYMTEFALDEYASLTANKSYWLKEPNLDTLTFRFITDTSQSANAVLTGEVDIATDLTGEAANTVTSSGTEDISLMQVEQLKIDYIRLNTTTGPTADINVRKALIMAVDWDAVVSALYPYGDAVRAYEPVPRGSWGYDSELEELVLPYDPEGAKELLTEAGYPDGFSITFYVSNTAIRQTLATVLQAYWAEVGVDCEVNISEWGTFSDYAASGTADVYGMSWTWYPDPYFFLNNLFASYNIGSNGNGANYSDPEVDDLLDKAAAATDQDERAEYYKEAMKIAMEAYSGSYYATTILTYAVNNRVTDFAQRADGTLRFVTEEHNVSVE